MFLLTKRYRLPACDQRWGRGISWHLTVGNKTSEIPSDNAMPRSSLPRVKLSGSVSMYDTDIGILVHILAMLTSFLMYCAISYPRPISKPSRDYAPCFSIPFLC